MNRDEITIVLFQNIDVDALTTAKREGNLLSYLSRIAERIIGPRTQNDYRPGRREDVNEPRSNLSTVRPPTPQLVRTGNAIRLNDSNDGVRISTL